MSAAKPVNLRTVADYVGLAPCSVSAILNDTLAAKVIPQRTKNRVFRAVAELDYRPNMWARSLRTKRTRMIAALASDFGQASVALVIAGAQARLHEQGYLLALGGFDFADRNHFAAQLQQRGIEGLVAIDVPVPSQLEMPITSVEFGIADSRQPTTPESRMLLRGMGNSAAEMIVQQIENHTVARG